MNRDTITIEFPAPLSTKSFAEYLLPNFEIVSDLKALERIEDRQKSLGSVTKEILKSRELAHQIETLT
ncbi:hypothetical protein BH10CYA1_BH10CYA1_14020 [soil metagenome]